MDIFPEHSTGLFRWTSTGLTEDARSRRCKAILVPGSTQLASASSSESLGTATDSMCRLSRTLSIYDGMGVTEAMFSIACQLVVVQVPVLQLAPVYQSGPDLPVGFVLFADADE